MKAVILAAGKSTRTYPLTQTRPKPLLKVGGKTILQHNLDQLKDLVDEVILIVGYKADMIKKQFKNKYGNLKLTYVEQKEQLGTGHALHLVKNAVKDAADGKFLVMNGDDVYFMEDLRKMVIQKSAAIMVKKVKNPSRFGVVVEKKGKVEKFVERPEDFVSDLANTGVYLFPKNVFDITIKTSPRGEFEIVDYIISLAKSEGVAVVKANNWFPIGYPWDLLDANEYLLSLIENKIEGVVENNVTVKGKVVIGKGTLVKSGTYIEGPVVIGENCTIGPNAYLRPSTFIGNNCKIGHEVEIKNCIINDNSAVPHLSYIGDSVIGENVNVAGGSITASFRHDAGLIRSSVIKEFSEVKDDKLSKAGEISEELVNTGRRKFGTIIGDNVKLGVKTIIYPGRKIFSGKSTLPGQVVKEDIR